MAEKTFGSFVNSLTEEQVRLLHDLTWKRMKYFARKNARPMPLMAKHELNRGNKILAIKEYKDYYECGLLEAKEAVEQYMESLVSVRF